MWDPEWHFTPRQSLCVMYCVQQRLKYISCRPREENWREGNCSLRLAEVVVRHGGEARWCATVQTSGQLRVLCAIARRSIAREGKALREKLGEKIKKSLTSYVYTTQVGSFMADVRQNGLGCRIATQAVAPGLVQLMVLLRPSHTSFYKTVTGKRPPWIWAPTGFLFIIFEKQFTIGLVLQGNHIRNTPNKNLVIVQMNLMWNSVLIGNPKYLNLAQFALTILLVIA